MLWPSLETWPRNQAWPEAYRRWAYLQDMQAKPIKDLEPSLVAERNHVFLWMLKPAIFPTQSVALEVAKANARMLEAELKWRLQGDDGPFR